MPSFEVTDAFIEMSEGDTQNVRGNMEKDTIEKCCYQICVFKDLPRYGPSVETNKFHHACNTSWLDRNGIKNPVLKNCIYCVQLEKDD